MEKVASLERFPEIPVVLDFLALPQPVIDEIGDVLGCLVLLESLQESDDGEVKQPAEAELSTVSLGPLSIARDAQLAAAANRPFTKTLEAESLTAGMDERKEERTIRTK